MLRGTDPYDEKAEFVRASDRLCLLEDEGASSLDRDPRKARGMRGLDGRQADRREVGPQFLAGLGAFDQHPALAAGKASVASQRPYSGKQRVRSLDIFQRHHPAADRDGGLADIQRAEGSRRLMADPDVSHVRGNGP